MSPKDVVSSLAAAKISGRQTKKHSIAGNRLINNTLTGTQINESKLGTVPNARHASSASHATSATHATSASHATTAGNATTADSAGTADTATSAGSVDGTTVHTFNFTVADNGASQTVTFPGGTLSGNCLSGEPGLVLTGDQSSGESFVSEGTDANTAFSNHDSDLTTSDSDPLSPPSPTQGAGTAVITRPTVNSTPGVATISYSYQPGASSSCIYTGTIISTP